MSRRNDYFNMDDGLVKYLPTPAQIRAECDKIQREWDEKLERSRSTSKRQSVDMGAVVRVGE